MKKTIGFYDFCRAFENSDRNETFSYADKRALFDHLEEQERDLGEEYELDVIELCCEFSECDSAVEAAEDHGWESADEDDKRNAREDEAIEWLRDETTVIDVDGGGVIVRNW